MFFNLFDLLEDLAACFFIFLRLIVEMAKF